MRVFVLHALALVFVVSGCGREPEARIDTGARQCLQDFFEAILREDWPKAYAALDAKSQRSCALAQFGNLAAIYRQTLGFPPEEVRVQLCAEDGDAATGRIVWLGQAAGKQQRFKDAVTLSRDVDDRWGVELPASWQGALRGAGTLAYNFAQRFEPSFRGCSTTT